MKKKFPVVVTGPESATLLRVGLLASLFLWLAASTLHAAPVITLSPDSHQFGEVIRGERVSHIFHIKNTGTSPLDISLVKTSCGCSAFFLKDRVVPPGASTPLRVEFDSTEFLGKVHKTIFIYSNDPRQQETSLSFTANVTTLIRVEPGSLNLGTVDLLGEGPGGFFPFRVALFSPNGVISKLDFNEQYFEASCNPEETTGGKSVYDCRLAVKRGAPSGSILEELTIRTNLNKQPFYKINIYGKIKGAFDLVPMLVDFGEVSSSETAKETLSIINTDQKPFKILKIEADRPEITCEASPVPGNFAYRITLIFSPGTLSEVVEGKIKIITDHPRSPKIHIKYQGFVE